jgi:hypothetical protein
MPSLPLDALRQQLVGRAANTTLHDIRIGDNPLGVTAGVKLIAGLQQISSSRAMPTIHLERCGLLGEVYGGDNEHDPNGMYSLNLAKPHDHAVGTLSPSNPPLACNHHLPCPGQQTHAIRALGDAYHISVVCAHHPQRKIR